MKKVILLDKKEGDTPLEALEKFRNKNKKHIKEYESIPMTYAGRLDPMASGLLLILAGEETKKKEKYLKLPKEYEFKVLFGFATDTYDMLGKVIAKKFVYLKTAKELKKEIIQNIKYFTGKFIQQYPLYSSKPVNGRALFQYAREGEKVEAPEHEVSVASLKLGTVVAISPGKLLKNITKRIANVKGPARNAKRIAFAGGDFRQEEILKIWHKELFNQKEKYYIADFKIKCSSGTYVRGIASSLGERMSIPALAFSIRRTKLGKWSKKSTI